MRRKRGSLHFAAGEHRTGAAIARSCPNSAARRSAPDAASSALRASGCTQGPRAAAVARQIGTAVAGAGGCALSHEGRPAGGKRRGRWRRRCARASALRLPCGGDGWEPPASARGDLQFVCCRDPGEFVVGPCGHGDSLGRRVLWRPLRRRTSRLLAPDSSCPFFAVGREGGRQFVASALICWMAALNPSGVPLEPATLERFTSSMFLPTTRAGIAWAKRV